MAQLVAPFNNSMRLGQGFNSYTHQIRLHNAVTVAPHGYTGTPSSSDSDPAWMHADERDQRYDEDDYSEEKSQIVTYSTRFVDKISEVVAPTAYIDSDKFKQSDVNYVVQVRVTNQRSDMRPRSKLNLVTSVKAASSQSDGNVLLVHDGGDICSIDLTKFRDVYGDTFISGWEEGGELNALISVKTKNKAKLNKIKGAIEARLGAPALSGKVSGSIDMEKSDTFSESETTITVNWSGGGKIKDYDILWDINSLTLAAANFPDNVMRKPQRTYAILSRYEELPDFQNKIPNYSALDYDLASVYTYALLDMYTDYKAIWKTLQISSSDAELGRIRFERARINQETMDYLCTYKPKLLTSSTDAPTGGSKAADASGADVKVADAKVADAKVGDTKVADTKVADTKVADTKVADTKGNAVTPEPTILERSLGLKSENGRVQPYRPSFLGLQSAKSAVRYQMLRIVGTVDDLKKNPRLVLNPDVGDILAPSVFRQLLPVAIPVPVNPNDDWIEPLGTSFSPEQNLTHANFEQFPQAKASALMNSEKAKHFRMSKWAGPAKPGQSPRFVFTSDLDRLSNSLLINSIRVYHEKLGITGIAIGYTNGTIAKHGHLKSNDHKEYPVRGRSVLSIQMAKSVSQQATDSTPEESGLVLFMLCFSNLETSQIKTGDYRPSAQDFTFSTAPDDHDGKPWNLAGFYSNFDTKTNRIESLGAIWTNDKEALSMPLLPLGMALEEFPPVLQDKIRESLDKSDKFRMSEWVGNLSYDRGPSSGFDLVKIEEERPFIKKVQFFYTQWGPANITHQIIGIEVTVACATQGPVPPGPQVFVGAIKLKITRPWDAVEKTRTVYAASKELTLSDKLKVVETKWLSWPLDAGKWSIRGFYGQWGEVIDRMGVIWGRDREKYGVEVKATEAKATEVKAT